MGSNLHPSTKKRALSGPDDFWRRGQSAHTAWTCRRGRCGLIFSATHSRWVRTYTLTSKTTGPKGPDRFLAERVGFEPTKGYKPLLVFKTSAFNRSATSPESCRSCDGAFCSLPAMDSTSQCANVELPPIQRYCLINGAEASYRCEPSAAGRV